MSAKPIDLSERNIPNTFAPKARNKFFSINGIIFALQLGLLKTEDVPEEIIDKFPDPGYNDKSPIEFKSHEEDKSYYEAKAKENNCEREG